MEINYLDFELMEKMCHRLAMAVFDTNEDPIAHFNDHEFSLLDSAIQSPRQTFDRKDLYETNAVTLLICIQVPHLGRSPNLRGNGL